MTIHHNANGVLTPPLPDDGEIPSVGVTQINGKLDKLPNGTAGHINGISSSSKYAIPLNAQLAFTPRKIRVITIGAGYSGLIIAHKFQHRFPEMQEMVEHKIFEARSDVGGTWLVNTYPGVQCDVPAQIYVCHRIQYLLNPEANMSLQAFPFDPNPTWSHFYASGAEIQEYIKNTVQKWNLDRDIQLNTLVTRAEWQAEEGLWKVTVEHEGQVRDEYAEVLLSAQGVLL
jgi:cation diffusion facilitator CzcD-associated flavoprotein CzcO